jgi:hypothetical protein
MNKKGMRKRLRVTDLHFSQTPEFIRATGYTPEGNHLDRKGDSVEVGSSLHDKNLWLTSDSKN